MDELKNIIKSNISLITALTSLGYMVSYFYQLSVAIYYGYPEEYISFDLDTLLRTMAFFLLLALIVIAPLVLISQLLSKKWVLLLSVIIMFVIYFIIFQAVNPFSFFSIRRAISLMAVISCPLMIISCIYTYLSRLNGVRNRMIDVTLIISFVFLIYQVPTLIGKLSSYAKENYFHLEEGKDYILLSSSGDKLIFGSCDRFGVNFILKDSSSVGVLTPIKNKDEKIKIRDCFFNRNFK